MKANTARVKFDGLDKLYDFKTNLDLMAGATVVCDTARGLSIATVVEIVPLTEKSTKWIVQEVDLKSHTEMLALEAREVELKQLMDKRIKELQELERYELVAMNDLPMRDMVTEYKKLRGLA